MVSVGQGRRSGRRGGMMATVQGLGNPGWEERRMDRWKKREGKEEKDWLKMEKEGKGIGGGGGETCGDKEQSKG